MDLGKGTMASNTGLPLLYYSCVFYSSTFMYKSPFVEQNELKKIGVVKERKIKGG